MEPEASLGRYAEGRGRSCDRPRASRASWCSRPRSRLLRRHRRRRPEPRRRPAHLGHAPGPVHKRPGDAGRRAGGDRSGPRAHPEVPLRRAVGSTAEFGLEAALPNVPDGPKKNQGRPRASKPKPDKPQGRPPTRSTLDAARGGAARAGCGAKARDGGAFANARRRPGGGRDERRAERPMCGRARGRARRWSQRADQAYRQAGGRDEHLAPRGRARRRCPPASDLALVGAASRSDVASSFIRRAKDSR